MNPRTAVVVLASVLAGSCGGGGGGGSSGDGSTMIFSTGAVTAIGSVVVNGIKFEDTAADITGDDSPKALADIRKLGAVLRIRGRINADGVTGVAERIEIENELRGPIDSVALPDTFVALGQTVVVDGTTFFDDTTGLAGADPLAVDDFVEVHGSRDAAGHIRATRVERIGGAVVDELKGIVTARTGTDSGTLTLGGTVFSYDASTIVVPGGAVFGVGSLVEVHLSGALITRLEVEDLDEADFRPGAGMESRIEGWVTGFSAISNPFFVGGQAVDATGAVFVGGVAADLANDVKVEAEGRMEGDVLVARRIEFRDFLRLQTEVASGTIASGDSGSFVALGLTVFVTPATRNNHGDIAPGDSLEIRGFVNTDGISITASRLDTLGSIDADRHILQSVVTMKDESTLHLVMLGIDVNASGSGVEFQDRNEAPLAPAAFFAAVVPGRTVVKARGLPGAGTLLANELEFE